MKKLTSRILTTAAATAVAIGVTMTPASAQETWTVSGGTEIMGSNELNPGDFEPLVATDLRTGAFATCDRATAKGTAKNGSGLAPEKLATLTETKFSDSTTADGQCPASTGTVGTLTSLGLPTSPDPDKGDGWFFNAGTYDSATGVTSGTLTGVAARASFSDGCTIKVEGRDADGNPQIGTIEGNYTNSTGELRLPPFDPDNPNNNLEVTEATDCNDGDAAVGDRIELDGVFKITPTLTVTSP